MTDQVSTRAYTAEEMRDMFMKQIGAMVQSWGNLKPREGEAEKTTLECCSGLAFSILALIDGTSIGIPMINMTMVPHESDKQYSIDNGENYFEPGIVFNDCSLHDLWYSQNYSPNSKS